MAKHIDVILSDRIIQRQAIVDNINTHIFYLQDTEDTLNVIGHFSNHKDLEKYRTTVEGVLAGVEIDCDHLKTSLIQDQKERQLPKIEQLRILRQRVRKIIAEFEYAKNSVVEQIIDTRYEQATTRKKELTRSILGARTTRQLSDKANVILRTASLDLYAVNDRVEKLKQVRVAEIRAIVKQTQDILDRYGAKVHVYFELLDRLSSRGERLKNLQDKFREFNTFHQNGIIDLQIAYASELGRKTK